MKKLYTYDTYRVNSSIFSLAVLVRVIESACSDNSEVKQSQIYDARLCTSNHEKTS